MNPKRKVLTGLYFTFDLLCNYYLIPLVVAIDLLSREGKYWWRRTTDNWYLYYSKVSFLGLLFSCCSLCSSCCSWIRLHLWWRWWSNRETRLNEFWTRVILLMKLVWHSFLSFFVTVLSCSLFFLGVSWGRCHSLLLPQEMQRVDYYWRQEVWWRIGMKHGSKGTHGMKTKNLEVILQSMPLILADEEGTWSPNTINNHSHKTKNSRMKEGKQNSSLTSEEGCLWKETSK